MKLKLSEIAAEYEKFRETHTHQELVERYVGQFKLLGDSPVMPTPACMEAILYLLKRNQVMAWRVFEAPLLVHNSHLTDWFQNLQRDFSTNTAAFDMSEPIEFQVPPQAIESMVMPSQPSLCGEPDTEPRPLRALEIEKLIIKPEPVPEPSLCGEPETPPQGSKKTVKA
jgi:hypothetical protein